MEERKKAVLLTTHSFNLHNKGNEFWAQCQIIYQSFTEFPKAMLDVLLEIGMLRADICCYVADIENKGLIRLLNKLRDENNKFTAGITLLIRIYSVKKIINGSIYGRVNDGRF